MASRLRGYDFVNVWQEFSGLANAHKAVNLGQGFPDWAAPAFVKNLCQKAISDNHNQYCRAPGEIGLVKSLAKAYEPLLGRPINPESEITCV
jgi:kynurenine--oxoglutarate transaminase/cysteine-S-conjugate beta-lyase/glutamine--phenylpyruvate transaminase